jgi:hypothetical protein
MSDLHNEEAHAHLIRIQTRLAEDSISQQRAIFERLEATDLGENARGWLQDAILAHQSGADGNCTEVLSCITRAVDGACNELGLDVQKGVVRGVLPVRGHSALSSDFYGTGVAIVAIDASLVPFTGMLADLLVQSFEYRESGKELAIVLDPVSCFNRITGGKTIIETSQDAQDGREGLVHCWERFFLHFAGLSIPWQRPQLRELKKALKYQLTSAMEVFVVGHEYAHHIHQHNAGCSASSSPPADDSYRYESEADRTAWRIAMHLGASGFAGKPTTFRNAWMESSSGAVAYLTAAEVVRRVREILETGIETKQQSVSHPSTYERLAALEEWDGFAGHPLQDEFRAQRRFLGRLMSKVYWYLRPKLIAAHKSGFRPTHI